MNRIALFAAASLAALGLNEAPAHAAGSLNRAWVSGKGTDQAGCGAPTNACRSLQYVVSNIIAPRGEIDILDPAGYGAVTIPFALSIVNDGVGTAGVQTPTAGENAITIDAGPSDAVTLRGLNIDGLGTGANGVVFNSGGSLTVVNCVIRHFVGGSSAGNGVLMLPSSGSLNFLISNTILSDNAGSGFSYDPQSGAATATGVIDRVTATNNTGGVVFVLNSASGGSVKVTISGSVASDNSGSGFLFSSAPGSLNAIVDSSVASNNGSYGVIQVDAPSNVQLSRSVIVSNNIGVSAASTIYSYGDNRINWSTISDINGTLNEASVRPR